MAERSFGALVFNKLRAEGIIKESSMPTVDMYILM
jgi:hypothetical protein